MSKLILVHDACLNQEVDAIVNAANRNLWSGGGVCGAIFRKAGYQELTEACQKIKTPLQDGDAVITEAFNIENAKYIIHAVGPNFAVNHQAFHELYLVYYNSLKVLVSNQLHSIAFPLISSGIFGQGLDNPIAVSTEQCLKAYQDFTKEYKDYEIEVRLCAYSDLEYQEAKKIIM